MNYQPTHVSRGDGSPAMVSQHDTESELCIVTNEDGVSWADFINNWQPIRREQTTPFVANVSEYECERWRQMSDELTGQADRLRNLARSSGEWQAIDLIESAARSLFGAFSGVMRERMKASDGN